MTGLLKKADTPNAPDVEFGFKADKEIYFEEGELLMPPTFGGTPLEKPTS